MGGAARAESKGLGGEAGFIDGLKEHEEDLLDDAVLERGRLGGGEEMADLTLGKSGRIGLIVGRAEEEVEAAAPAETTIENGIAEGEERVQGGPGDGGAGLVGSRGIGSGLLVGKEPELRPGEERGKGRRRRGWGAEVGDPEVG